MPKLIEVTRYERVLEGASLLEAGLKLVALAAALLAGAPAWAQDAKASPAPGVQTESGTREIPDSPPIVLNDVTPGALGIFDPQASRTFLRYSVPELEPMKFNNVRQVDWPIVNGKVKLSIQEAIALAIDNNLDVESVRLAKPMVKADIARARSGQLLRSASAAAGPGIQTAAPGSGAPAFNSQGTPPAFGGALNTLASQLLDSEIPDTEPTLFASGRFSNATLPLANQTVTGTNFLKSKEQDWQVGVRKGFLTGTTVTAQFESLRTSRNAPFDTINPALSANAFLRVDQHLLRGFGLETNSRMISISRNNGRKADLNFRMQVELVVSQVLALYYDLAASEDEIDLSVGALNRASLRLKEMQQQMEEGVASQSDVIACEMDVATGQQRLTGLRSQMADQEALLKSLLTRSGLEDPAIMKAHITPTDRFTGATGLVDADPTELADRAIARRPEIRLADLSLANEHLELKGTRNALMPTLDVYATLQSNGLAGRLNPLAPGYILSQANNGFVGGFGTVLDQLATRAYPDYEAGFQLSMPLMNRAAQADLTRQETDLRQQEISVQMLHNSIRLQTMRSAQALKQARAQYELSVKARELTEKSLETERKMFVLGATDPVRLETVQANLERAQLQEVASLNTYARAQVALSAILNQTLDDNGVVINEAENTNP